jgi:hypothetical protein
MPALECRLLCASACAYGIDENGAFTPPQPQYDAAGFQAAPKAVVGGVNNINACLVGKSTDGIVVAFRGTLSFDVHDLPSLLDWMQDFDAVPVEAAGIPGRVHSGFLRDLDTVWVGTLAEVRSLQAAAGGSLPVYVTGHSKGGAIAHLAAMRFQAAGMLPAEVYTYAAPRAGDAAFAAAYNNVISAFRYEYADDIVPHLPPDIGLLNALRNVPFLGQRFNELPDFDYADVGTLRFIDWDGDVVGDSRPLEAERVVRLSLLVVQGKFQQIVADHSSGCGNGYMTATCPGVCPGPQ